MPRKGDRKPYPVIGDPDDPRGMPALLGQFLEWMRVQNYSEDTVQSRQVCLALFVQWSHDRGVTRPGEVTKPILERYQRYLFHYRKKDGDPLSFRSQQARLVPIRAWFKWLARHNHILYNPASELELTRVETR